jgi:hypothetical protein
VKASQTSFGFSYSVICGHFLRWRAGLAARIQSASINIVGQAVVPASRSPDRLIVSKKAENVGSQAGLPAPHKNQGAVAQLGERLICIQEVAGSIPTSSTNLKSL